MSIQKVSYDPVKAIEKAMKNGWQPFEEPIISITVSTAKLGDMLQLRPYVRFEVDGETDYCFGLSSVIYDHDFAKALWGEVPLHPFMKPASMTHFKLSNWQYHLQQMVIADDPVRYVAEHL